MKQIKTRKKKMQDILKQEPTETNIYIYFFLINNKLDNILKNLEETTINQNIPTLNQSKSKSSEEQLIEILKYLIDTFNKEFWFLQENRALILESLINSKAADELIHTKKYINDNQYIEYFFNEFQKILISIFQQIIKETNNEKKLFLKRKDQKILKDQEKLYHFLKEICFCNNTSYHLIYLFDNNFSLQQIPFYSIQLDILLKNTYQLKKENQSFLNLILK